MQSYLYLSPEDVARKRADFHRAQVRLTQKPVLPGLMQEVVHSSKGTMHVGFSLCTHIAGGLGVESRVVSISMMVQRWLQCVALSQTQGFNVLWYSWGCDKRGPPPPVSYFRYAR